MKPCPEPPRDRDTIRVITYGTFDLFHDGHRRLLERGKALGGYLVVGVTTESYDEARGKLNVRQSLLERIQNVADSGLADEIIVEEYEGQKIHDIQRLGIDVFVVGSDWFGQFDYLKDYCRVVYLDRTKGISSTELRGRLGITRLGIIGAGRIASRFVAEARYVSGTSVEAVYSRDRARTEEFTKRHELRKACASLDELLGSVDAVYVATPHGTHYEYAKLALLSGRHVLCEKPLALRRAEAVELFELAAQRRLVLLEAIKTAFCPGFQRMVAIARSGSIGRIRSVQATCTKLVSAGRELQPPDGGSISELASYPLLALVKLLGTDFTSINVRSFREPDSPVDLFSRIDLTYPYAIGCAQVGLGVKSEGDLVVAGTRGYVYVSAPWWKTEHFETRFENPADNRRYYFRFEGDGLRYELAEFAQLIQFGQSESFRLRQLESVTMAGIIEEARANALTFA